MTLTSHFSKIGWVLYEKSGMGGGVNFLKKNIGGDNRVTVGDRVGVITPLIFNFGVHMWMVVVGNFFQGGAGVPLPPEQTDLQ